MPWWPKPSPRIRKMLIAKLVLSAKKKKRFSIKVSNTFITYKHENIIYDHKYMLTYIHTYILTCIH